MKRLEKIKLSIWNSKKKQFIGRDGLGWAALCLYYGVFYALLAGFILVMTLFFMVLTPKDRPKYILGESSMAVLTPLNPGLGYRPQINVGNELISIFLNANQSKTADIKAYIKDLHQFTDAYNNSSQMDCSNVQSPEHSKSCLFDMYHEECSVENDFGYSEGEPCVLIKLNRIYGWTTGGAAKCPGPMDISDGKGSIQGNGDIRIRCEGESVADNELMQPIKYLSHNGISSECADIPNTEHYFPFKSLQSYRSPYVWAKFRVQRNVVVSIICRAYADNIDSIDKLHMRGMLRFKLLVADEHGPKQ